MAGVKLYGKDLSAYDDIDVDALLLTLNEDELEQLGAELIDPDDSHIPPSERCAYRTTKAPTGPYNRKHLIDFLEKKAKEEKDWDEAKPYAKEVRGKVWKPKEKEKIQITEDGDEDVETEWDEVLQNASEEELVDLAAILGFYGMLNQVQYHQAFVTQGDAGDAPGGFAGVAKCENFKTVPDEPPNTANPDEVLQKMKDNDKSLTEVNLNNIKNIPLSTLRAIGEALSTNTTVESLSIANTNSTDRVCRSFAEGLKENKTLKVLNMESNYIRGEAIGDLLEGINEKQVVTELHVANQRPQTMGVKSEQRISMLMKENRTIVRFGICLETRDARVKLQDYLQRNYDASRKLRLGIKDDDPPPKKEVAPAKAKETKAAPPKSAPPPKKDEPKAPAPKAAAPKPAEKKPAPAPKADPKPAAPPPKKAPAKKEESSSSSEDQFG